ncbi:MAG: hypothetical protein WCO33_02840 [bacterium]
MEPTDYVFKDRLKVRLVGIFSTLAVLSLIGALATNSNLQEGGDTNGAKSVTTNEYCYTLSSTGVISYTVVPTGTVHQLVHNAYVCK